MEQVVSYRYYMLYHENPITNEHCFTQLLDFTDYQPTHLPILSLVQGIQVISHHLMWALTPFDTSAHTIWCERSHHMVWDHFSGNSYRLRCFTDHFTPISTQHIQKYSSQTKHPSCHPHARLRWARIHEWRVKEKLPNFIQLYAYARARKPGAGKISRFLTFHQSCSSLHSFFKAPKHLKNKGKSWIS